MSDIQNVQLGFSCPIRREEMTKTAKGRFCSGCSKEVIDFTDKSKEDLQHIIKSANSNVCGSFKASQLSQSFLKYVAATAIASSTLLGACQEKEITPEKQVDIESEEVIEGFVITGDILDTTNYEHQVYVNPMVYAGPIGGYEKLYQALGKEIRYPEGLVKTGKVYVRIKIDESGKLTEVEILKGFDSLAENEAIRAIKVINHPFTPATINGVPEVSDLIIPVRFQPRTEY